MLGSEEGLIGFGGRERGVEAVVKEIRYGKEVRDHRWDKNKASGFEQVLRCSYNPAIQVFELGTRSRGIPTPFMNTFSCDPM